MMQFLIHCRQFRVWQSHWDKRERNFYWKTYLSYLDLKCGLWISKMGFVVFYGFISPIETISTLVAMPVSTFKLLFSFDDTNNITVITASQNFKPCIKLNIIKSSFVHIIYFFDMIDFQIAISKVFKPAKSIPLSTCFTRKWALSMTGSW